MAWYDDVTLKLYISESGDFVSLGTRTDIPLNSGGSGGIPAGFTLYAPSGHSSEINWTTANGRFSISNASTTDPQLYRQLGAQINIPMELNKRYIMNVQAQSMEGKSTAGRYVVNGRVVNGTSWGVLQTAVSPWENIALYSDFTSSADTFFVRLMAYNQNNSVINWGVQYQNLAIITIPTTIPPPVWHEVTCDIRNLSIREGRERATNRYEVGQAQIGVLNDNGEFSYQPNHPWGLRPGRFVKVEATYNFSTYPVYYGLIDGMSNTYTLDGHALTTMNCVDVSSLLANQTVPGMSNAETIQYSGTRFAQILNGIAWHPSQTNWQQGSFGMRGITANGRTIRDEIGLIADSEGSYFWADRVGKLFYRGRDWADGRITNVGAELLAQLPTDPIVTPSVRFVFPGINGNRFQTPTAPALEIAGDFDLICRIAITDWASAGFQFFLGKYGSGGFSYFIGKGGGNRNIQFNAGGSTKNVAAPAEILNSTPVWLKCSYVRATGTLTHYWAVGGTNNNEPSNWTQFGTNVGTVGAANPIGPSPVTMGSNPTGNSPMYGRLYRAIIKSAGVIVFDVNESDAAGMPGALAFTSSSGHPITVVQTPPWVLIDDTTTIEYLPVVDDIPTYPNAPIVCTNALDTTWSRDRVINELSLANQDGSAITVVDAESQKKYGPRTYSRMDFLNDNAHPEYLTLRANDIMGGVTEASIRVNSVSFNPAINEHAWYWALTCFMNDLVRVRYTHPTEGWGFSAVAHIQGIEHTIDTKKWSMRLALDDYEAFTYYEFAEIASGWDIGLWDDDIWDGAGNPNTPAYWNAKYLWSNDNSKWG